MTNVSPSSLSGEDLAVVGPRRRREAAGLGRNSLPSVDLLAGPGVVRREESRDREACSRCRRRRATRGCRSRASGCDQAMNGLLVSSPFSDMSPEAPGRIAYTGRKRVGDVAGVDEQQTVGGKRRRDVDGRHPGQLPQHVAVEIVGTGLDRAGHDELGSPVVPPHERRRPVSADLALPLP